jgi:7-cyano-7-deazaguanine synthase
LSERKTAVVLLSGGLDSAVAAALAINEGFEICALTFDYGQRHRWEVKASEALVRSLGAARHAVFELDLRTFGGSALTGDMEVPRNRTPQDMPLDIPVTYVPARNTIFLSVALAWCEVLQAQDIFIGVNRIDFSGYPDCRPAFIEQFERLAQLATKAGVEGRAIFRIHAPLMEMSKAQIIQTGCRIGVDLSLTHSCYDPAEGGLACGGCDACILRRRGFEEAGVPDPTRYAAAL